MKWLQAKEDGIEDSHVKVKDNITVSLSYKLEKRNVPGKLLLPDISTKFQLSQK